MIIAVSLFCAFFAKLYLGEYQQSRVKIASGNGLVPSDNKPLLELLLTQIYVTLWRHQAVSSYTPTYLLVAESRDGGILLWRNLCNPSSLGSR